MSLRRQLLASFGLQGLGAASLLLAMLGLGASLGPAVQGVFARTKSEIEFVAALAMFGLPQALFFHVKSGRLTRAAALRWVRWSAVAALLIGAVYAMFQHAGEAAWSIAALGAAVGANAAHGQLRGLLLLRERTAWFNVITALPQVLLLAGVAGVIGWGGAVASTWYLLFAGAYGLVAWLAWHRLAPGGGDTPVVIEAGWRALGHYGLATWLTAVLSTAAMLAAQRWIESAQGPSALGRFTLAMTLVQVPLTPIAYAAPLLLRRWMEVSGAHRSQRWAAALFTLLLGAAGIAWGLAPVWPDFGLGVAYAGVAHAFALLLAGAAAEAASRVLTVQASASGRPWVAVRAEAARWSVLLAGALLPLPAGLLAVCAVWAVGAAAAAAVFAWHAQGAAAAGGRAG